MLNDFKNNVMKSRFQISCFFRFILLLLGVTLIQNSYSQEKISWPPITKESRPWARWWWMGSAVNDSDLTYNMQLYKNVGLGGLEITPIYGVKGEESKFINFLSPQWLNEFSYTLNEAKRLGLGIDLANATGWPFGGPWVSQDDAAKYIAYKIYKVNGGQKLSDTIKYIQKQIIRDTGHSVDVSEIRQPVATTPDLQKKALDQVRLKKPLPVFKVLAYPETGNAIDVTSHVTKDGLLNWVAPEGKWTIYALFMGNHGKLVERAAPGGEGDVIDHFSEVALMRYLNEFDGAFKKMDLSQLRSFFNDSYEVDDATGEANWTPRFFEEFKKRRGYDLQNYLPLLFSKTPDEQSKRVLCDYRETVSDLIYEHFTTVWHNWAQKKGKMVRNQAHGSPANLLDLYSVVDIPEIEGTIFLRMKFASSASNILGKPYTSAEAATWLNDHFLSNLGDVKIAMDRYLLAGVNHNFYHGVNYSPKNEPWPGWLFYAAVHFQPVNPFWTDFAKLNHYVTRCQSVLQQSKPDNDVLLYIPMYESWSEPYAGGLLRHYDGFEKNFNDAPVELDTKLLQSRGYGFDYISDRLLQKTDAIENSIVAPGGNYQTLVFSQPNLIPEETMIKVLKLAENGATIIFHKSLPSDVPGFNKLAQRQELLKKLLNSIVFEQVDSFKIASFGKGKIMLGNNLQKLLEKARIRRESIYGKGFQCIRKKNDKGEVYFISYNSTKDSIWNGWLSLSAKETSVALLNPMDGSSGIAHTRVAKSGNTEVYLQLHRNQSVILQFSSKPFKGDKYPFYNETSNTIPVDGKWSLTFLSGGPFIPKPLFVNKLVSWTEIAGDSGKYFSGTASYKIALPQLPGAKNYVLKLGKVCETARIYINGTPVDTLIGPNFQTIIPASALSKENILEIQVSNKMANRIEYLDKNNVTWKKFYNINFSARLPENRGEDGLFTTKKWNPLTSGLLGPVTITPLEIIKD